MFRTKRTYQNKVALSVSDVRTALEDQLKDISDVSTDVFASWCDYVNKAIYRVVSGMDAERFIAEQDYTVSSGNVTKPLPATFRGMDALGTGLFYTNSDGTTSDRQLARTFPGSTQDGFYLNGGNVVFTPSTRSTSTFRMRFLPKPVRIVDLTAYFTVDSTALGNETIPDEFLEQLVSFLCKRYFIWDENPALEGNADQRLMNAMDEFVRGIRREGTTVTMPDFAQDY